MHGGDLAIRDLYCGSGAACLGAPPRARPVPNAPTWFKSLAEHDPSGLKERAWVVESKYAMPNGPRYVAPNEWTYQQFLGGAGNPKYLALGASKEAVQNAEVHAQLEHKVNDP